MMTIRRFKKTDSDYQAMLDIVNTLWPDEAQSVAELKYEDDSWDSRYTHEHFVGEVDGRIVASGVYAHCSWSHVPGKYLVSVDVHPDHQGQGHGSQVFDFLMSELGRADADSLVTWTRDDKPDYVRFITSRGFEFSMRYAVSRLDVESLDLSEFSWAPGKMKEQGVEILCLTELAERDPDWKRAWYDLAWELFQDVPSVDEVTRPSFETWNKRFENPGYRMNMHWFAKDGDRLVGYTGLWLSEAHPAKVFTGLTGVVRSHRRKGIATALKVHGFSRAKEHGAKFIETDNEEKNPMFDLNMRLGFKPTPAWTEYRRPFADARAEKQMVEASEGA
jgi:GNAT superfamily N-acetyltransferase